MDGQRLFQYLNMLTYGLTFSALISLRLGSVESSTHTHCTISGSGMRRFGDKCQYDCHCVIQSEQCHVTTGNCVSGCDFEWVGPGCQFKNIAYGQQVRHESNTKNPCYSDLANDNNVSTCSYTSDNTASAPWWNLWLREHTAVTKLEFVTTRNHLTPFLNFEVLVYNTTETNFQSRGQVTGGLVCYKHNNTIPLNTKIQVTCKGSPVGNMIRLQLHSNYSQLVLCDFRLYEDCKNDFYGIGCESCSDNCDPSAHRTCRSNDGSCLSGCKSGWKGDRCDLECEDGRWGLNCQNDCGKCLSSSCNHVNGTCIEGCSPGYKSTKECKTECDPGYFGKDCNHRCNQTCSRSGNARCNNVNGTCMNACVPGYKGSFCELECEYGKWGLDCKNDCGKCLSLSCDHVNGTCSEGCAPGYKSTEECKTECDPGYFGKDCIRLCNRTCSISGRAMCDRVNGTCIDGCLEGYTGSYCEIVSDQELSLSSTRSKEISNMNLVPISLGIICAILLVYAAIVTVMFKHNTSQMALLQRQCYGSTNEAAIALSSDINNEYNLYTELTPHRADGETTYASLQSECTL